MKILSRVTVTVPATTSNLGPGFDCLGLALSLRNELALELHEGRGPVTVEISGEGAKTLPRDERNVLVKAARLALPKSLPGHLVFKSVNRIPLARGLGSSAAAAVAGLWAGAHLFGALRTPEDDLEKLAIALEGHPDNVAPCVHGGLTASLIEKGQPCANRLIAHPSLSAVVCIPDFELPTKKARAVLPRQVPLADAVHNISRAALLVRALETGRMSLLANLMDDRLHQPYRARLIPGLSEVLAAAVKAGATGAALSGSGPTVFAFVKAGRAAKVGTAMKRAFASKNISSRWLALAIDREGVRIER